MNLKDIAWLGRTAAAPSVLPSDFSGLQGWWDASNLSYANDTPIDDASAKFTDRSSNANHAIQATSAARPLVKTGIINGLRVVRFDPTGTADFLSFTSIGTFSADYTIIFVGTVSSGVDGVILGGSGVNIQFRMNLSAANVIAQYLNAVTRTSNTFGTASNVIRMSVWRRTGISIEFRENKTDRSPGGISDGSSFTLEWMGKYWFGQPITADVGEILIYKGTYLTNTQCDSLYDNYFKTKWGLP
jgi:hypothetical protein